MNGRRTLIVAAGAALAAPLLGRAQTRSKVHRIGWLSPVRNTTFVDAFSAGMRELGWVEGLNYTLEILGSEGYDERMPALAAELVRRNVDLIICTGTTAAAAAKAATATIPIVFYYAADPVGSGLVASLARPGGNATGLGGLSAGVQVKLLELLREAVPKASRIAVLHNPAFPVHAVFRAEVEQAARSLGVAVRPIELRSQDDIDAAFAALAREPVDALLILGQPFVVIRGAQLAAGAIELRLPAAVGFLEGARAGMLMAYASELIDDVRRLPSYVDRIFKGTPPAELPVEQPTRFRLVINLKTAKAIGLKIPQSLLLRTEEVIE